MTDYSKLSDAELMQKIEAEKARLGLKQPTIEQAPSPSKSYDFSHMSDDELKAAIASKLEGPSLGSQVMDTVIGAGKALDEYTGAPVRAGLNQLLRTTPEFGKNPPSVLGNIMEAGKAAYNQFGENSDLAPTGKDIAIDRLGMSSKPMIAGTPSFAAAKGGVAPESGIVPGAVTRADGVSPAGVFGLAMDIAADPTNIVPLGAVAKVGVRGASEALNLAKDGALIAARAVPGAKSAERIGKTVVEGLDKLINPKIAADFGELQAIAAKHDIPLETAPEAIKYGDRSVIANLDRVQMQNLSAQRLENYKNFQQNVTNAFDDTLAKISAGAPLDRVNAGEHMRQAFDNAYSNLMDKVQGATYKQISESLPGLKLSEDASKAIASKLNGMEKFAKGQLKRGLSEVEVSQAKGLLNAVNAVRNTNGSFKQAVETLQAIGRTAYETRNTLAAIPPDVKQLRDLYKTIQDGLFTTIESEVKGGPEIVGSLKISNELMSDFFKSRDSIGNILGNPRLAPEQVFERLTKNTDQIKALANLLKDSPEDFAKIKGAFLQNMIKRDEFGNISWKQLKNSLESKQSKDVFNVLFTPDEQAQLAEIATLGDRAGPAILNPSGTDRSNLLRNLKQGIEQTVFNEGVLDALKARAEKPAIPKPMPPPLTPEAQTQLFRNMLGPQNIGFNEAVGIRLPKVLSIQKTNNERNR